MLHIIKYLIPMCSLNSAELFGVGLVLTFYLQNCHKWKTYFFELFLGNLSDLHQTLREASVNPPDKMLSKELW